jgi:hypothetical protein
MPITIGRPEAAEPAGKPGLEESRLHRLYRISRRFYRPYVIGLATSTPYKAPGAYRARDGGPG